MNEKKHIDRLFQEKFKHFEVTPDPAVWDNIHDALHKDKRKRRVIPIWWFTTGVAALLVIGLTLGTIFNNDEPLDIPENSVVEFDPGGSQSRPIDDFEQNNSELIDNGINGPDIIAHTEHSDANSKNIIDEKTADSQRATDASNLKNTTASNSQDKIAIAPNKSISNSNSKEDLIVQNISNLSQLDANQDPQKQGQEPLKIILETEKEYTKIAKTTDQITIKDTKISQEHKDIITLNKPDENIEDAIAKANLINEEEEKEEQPNRWNISPNVAPVYFNSLGKGSSIDQQFVNNGKSGEINMSYGINGSYAINDKIKIRAGVHKVEMGYSTDGVVTLRDVLSFNISTDQSMLKNINLSTQHRGDLYMSSPNTNFESAPQFVVSSSNGILEQQFGYIEVPLEIEYSLISSKFGLNVIGGFSTLFLNNNDIYSVLENERSLLGEANNMNNTSYSANFGLGLNYNLSPTLKLNVEPMFKYQINTFNNTSGDFRPYFIGVYSGFSFKF